MFKRVAQAGAGVAATLALAAAGSAAPAVSAKSCPKGYTSAYIHGKHECLHAGEYCSHKYEKQYLKYHYTCYDDHGTYRLKKH